jgi:hypothetical protein
MLEDAFEERWALGHIGLEDAWVEENNSWRLVMDLDTYIEEEHTSWRLVMDFDTCVEEEYRTL